MPEKVSEIRARFAANLDRVRRLVALYEEVSALAPGRPTVHEADILRAAVVLLHATVEDLMRSLAQIRLPAASPEILSRIPVARGDGRKTTFTLGELAAYRGRAVDDVIIESIDAYLDRRSYNNTDDLSGALRELGLPSRLDAGLAPILESLMKRRHHIAHRLDLNKSSGRGHHAALSISKSMILRWADAVNRFGTSVLDEHDRGEIPAGGTGS